MVRKLRSIYRDFCVWYSWTSYGLRSNIKRFFMRHGLYGAGKCSGCSMLTKNYCHIYEWYICHHCCSQDVANKLVEHVMYPNGINDDIY